MDRPGVGLRPNFWSGPCIHPAISAAARGSSASAATWRSGWTTMVAPIPNSTTDAMRSGEVAAASSAMKAPMEWPIRWIRSPRASARAAAHAARSPTEVNAGPSESPCPGRSTASARVPWWASQRVCCDQTDRSMPAPWRSTTSGAWATSSRSMATAPVAALTVRPSTENCTVPPPSVARPAGPGTGRRRCRPDPPGRPTGGPTPRRCRPRPGPRRSSAGGWSNRGG